MLQLQYHAVDKLSNRFFVAPLAGKGEEKRTPGEWQACP